MSAMNMLPKPPAPAAPPSPPMMPFNPSATTTTVLTETYNSSLQSVNMGFALAAALSWNEAVKEIIKKYVKRESGVSYYVYYAILLTILSAFVFAITKQFFKPSIKRTQITPVIGAR